MPLGMPTTTELREKLCDKTPDGLIASEIHESAACRFRISEADINIETSQLMRRFLRRQTRPSLASTVAPIAAIALRRPVPQPDGAPGSCT